MSLTNSSRIAAPLTFAASQYFEGNDGKWSTFVVRAGSPEQVFRVLPSTVAGDTLVPILGACKEGSPVHETLSVLLSVTDLYTRITVLRHAAYKV